MQLPLILFQLITVKAKNIGKTDLCLHQAVDKLSQKWKAKWLEPRTYLSLLDATTETMTE